ncbi:unnamed protein product [Penicillium olsonii]|nr:unnamed protein product [Penicillium olsonii]
MASTTSDETISSLNDIYTPPESPVAVVPAGFEVKAEQNYEQRASREEQTQGDRPPASGVTEPYWELLGPSSEEIHYIGQELLEAISTSASSIPPTFLPPTFLPPSPPSILIPTSEAASVSAAPPNSHLHFTQFFHLVNFSDMAWPIGPNAPPGPPGGDMFPLLQDFTKDSLKDMGLATIGEKTNLNVLHDGGVVKITNIPFTCTRQDVNAFLGRGFSSFGTENGPHIHIMMERSTGKTMDCFVEFQTEKDAKKTVTSLNRNHDLNKGTRLGSRHVDVELSNPAELMKAYFPLAKAITWDSRTPVKNRIKPNYSTGFQGLFTDEELFCLQRLAEQPARSVFANKIPQRAFESYIGTLWKFPWHAANMYTIAHRNKLYDTLILLQTYLREFMAKKNTVGLDHPLVLELANAGLRCPGFNPRQKYEIAQQSGDEHLKREFSRDWCMNFPFETLTYLPNCNYLNLQLLAYVVSHGCIDTPGGQFEKKPKGPHPGTRHVWGKWYFQWTKAATRTVTFASAQFYENSLLAGLLDTGYDNVTKNRSISTIGTAPHSSQEGDNDSVASEGTIVTTPVAPAGGNPPSTTFDPSTMPMPVDVPMPTNIPEGGNIPMGPPAPVAADYDIGTNAPMASQYPMASQVPMGPPAPVAADHDIGTIVPMASQYPMAPQVPMGPNIGWGNLGAYRLANPAMGNDPMPGMAPMVLKLPGGPRMPGYMPRPSPNMARSYRAWQRGASLRNIRHPSEFSPDWTFPDSSTGAYMEASSQPAQQESAPRPASERTRPYQPPHVRAMSSESGASTGYANMLYRARSLSLAESASSLHSSGASSSVPIYYTPHATAQNVRSSSFPNVEMLSPISEARGEGHHRAVSEAAPTTLAGVRASRRLARLANSEQE